MALAKPVLAQCGFDEMSNYDFELLIAKNAFAEKQYDAIGKFARDVVWTGLYFGSIRCYQFDYYLYVTKPHFWQALREALNAKDIVSHVAPVDIFHEINNFVKQERTIKRLWKTQNVTVLDLHATRLKNQAAEIALAEGARTFSMQRRELCLAVSSAATAFCLLQSNRPVADTFSDFPTQLTQAWNEQHAVQTAARP